MISALPKVKDDESKPVLQFIHTNLRLVILAMLSHVIGLNRNKRR